MGSDTTLVARKLLSALRRRTLRYRAGYQDGDEFRKYVDLAREAKGDALIAGLSDMFRKNASVPSKTQKAIALGILENKDAPPIEKLSEFVRAEGSEENSSKLLVLLAFHTRSEESYIRAFEAGDMKSSLPYKGRFKAADAYLRSGDRERAIELFEDISSDQQLQAKVRNTAAFRMVSNSYKHGDSAKVRQAVNRIIETEFSNAKVEEAFGSQAHWLSHILPATTEIARNASSADSDTHASQQAAIAAQLFQPCVALPFVVRSESRQTKSLARFGALEKESYLANFWTVLDTAHIVCAEALGHAPTHADANALLSKILLYKHTCYGIEIDLDFYAKICRFSAEVDETPKGNKRLKDAALDAALMAGSEQDALDMFENRWKGLSGKGRVVPFGHQQDFIAKLDGQADKHSKSTLDFRFNAYAENQRLELTESLNLRAMNCRQVNDLCVFDRRYIWQDDKLFGPEDPSHFLRKTDHILAAAGSHALIVDDCESVNVDAPVVLLGGSPAHYDNFFHAVAQNFGRLPYLAKIGALDGRKIAIDSDTPGWGLTFLELMGFKDEQLFKVEAGVRYRFRDAILPDPPRMTEMLEPQYFEPLRERIQQLVGTRKRSRNIYFSRREIDSERRPLLNESELLELAEKRGFEILDPASLSLLDQVKMMAEARAIIGPTGAALTNVLFACEPIKVGVMSAREACLNYFQVLSGYRGHEHHWILGRFVDGLIASERFPVLPYQVEIQDFERALDQICSD
ncbi:glycosyltransferase family 61 protein [Aliiroseovarius sp. Z3]|uniref:glycosyltransferase family 61 protein n=1 Tax=Aliiroseovarius sp. Z3 TaxID=2811402 RepID=UPI0023B2F2B3|nr:glycosyltransferase family 61 protein [Aliiroseovarius sp. Z3]MDE9449054.1 glycosyltransferase family 61 protein [Aliiroseovarius sp. Z3]